MGCVQYGNNIISLTNCLNTIIMGLDLYFNRVKRKVQHLKSFRKVNFLVKFFEDQGLFNYENPVPITVDKELAEELLDRCEKVLEDHSKAKKLLPTMEGFFFGSTEYDDYYFDDVKEVRDFLRDKLLPEYDKLEELKIEGDVSYEDCIQFYAWF